MGGRPKDPLCLHNRGISLVQHNNEVGRTALLTSMPQMEAVGSLMAVTVGKYQLCQAFQLICTKAMILVFLGLTAIHQMDYLLEPTHSRQACSVSVWRSHRNTLMDRSTAEAIPLRYR